MAPSSFAQTQFPTTSTAATLDPVLGGDVGAVRPAGERAAAASGTSLAVGDRILTGPEGRGLITFLDGTTVTVEPRSEVTVRELEVGDRQRSNLQVLITAGTVWARIANLLGGRGTVSLASNTHAAIAHDGLIGAEQRADGTFVCWTARGHRPAHRRERNEPGRPRAGTQGDHPPAGPPDDGESSRCTGAPSRSPRVDPCGRSS